MRLQINVTYGPVVKALECGIQVPGSSPTRLFPSTIPSFFFLSTLGRLLELKGFGYGGDDVFCGWQNKKVGEKQNGGCTKKSKVQVDYQKKVFCFLFLLWPFLLSMGEGGPSVCGHHLWYPSQFPVLAWAGNEVYIILMDQAQIRLSFQLAIYLKKH